LTCISQGPKPTPGKLLPPIIHLSLLAFRVPLAPLLADKKAAPNLRVASVVTVVLTGYFFLCGRPRAWMHHTIGNLKGWSKRFSTFHGTDLHGTLALPLCTVRHAGKRGSPLALD
jgi:hypothetical protein